MRSAQNGWTGGRATEATSGRPTVTVLTPAFNRAHTLPRLYRSLVAQTHRSFEWIVVDDGSSDGTEQVVSKYRAADEIDVRYERQPNSGKHVAVNRGAELARGAFTTIVDSDDWLVPDALRLLLRIWARIPDDQRANFSGVVGLASYEDGAVIGDRFPADPLDCDPAELSYVYRVRGDKQSLLRTDVLREYPFPFEGTRGLVPEGLVWNRMALKYKERHVNEVVLIKEYQSGGLTARALELQIQSAIATRQFYFEEARLPRPLGLGRRLRSHANVARFSFHAGIGVRAQVRQARSIFGIAGLPAGYAVYRADRRRLRAAGA